MGHLVSCLRRRHAKEVWEEEEWRIPYSYSAAKIYPQYLEFLDDRKKFWKVANEFSSSLQKEEFHPLLDKIAKKRLEVLEKVVEELRKTPEPRGAFVEGAFVEKNAAKRLIENMKVALAIYEKVERFHKARIRVLRVPGCRHTASEIISEGLRLVFNLNYRGN